MRADSMQESTDERDLFETDSLIKCITF